MQIQTNVKTQMPLILMTAFLDILGFSLLIPVIPDITALFAQSESWTMWAQSIYSLGMFITGAFVGNLSDKYGRKRLLIVTTSFNILGYVLTYIGIHLGTTIGLTGFLIYLGARFIAGVGGSGFAVVQAYVSDISSPTERAKNMGMMGAAFGAAFLIGPAIGGVLSHVAGIEGILMISTLVITINLLWIIFGLPEPRRHQQIMDQVDIAEWSISREVKFLLVVSLFATIGFSVIQSGSAQYTTDRFGFDADMRGYVMGVVGFMSILYQGFLIKYTRRFLVESQMIYYGLFIVAVTMIAYAINPIASLVFVIIAFFPIGMGMFNPSLASLLSKDAGKHTGRVMGLNTSMTGIGGIVGPLLVGWLYAFHHAIPFFAGGALFLALWMISFIYFHTKKQRQQKESI